ncbi:uncharacterized protein K444DRAFT_661806 [Hyaloscypha bicolor E]|uniref:Uncharacterized protein n=1 Tax=Hyaloscypha bicolor E TaxID=1095630 RepID=A0A2J6TI75_9HELO|nr:uncharacterized protein K444DRAFT_661806 [Hyaloscypha bicolor E]PMD62721.1 hypothetical protein K444DRAFT_661806 [Hyaloscypha bicolor E]
MADKDAKKAKHKAKLEKKRRRYQAFGFIAAGISEDETDSEGEAVEEAQQQDKKGKGKVDIGGGGTDLAPAINREDPTGETIKLFVAGYRVDANKPDWLHFFAKFDSGADDDWISERLVSDLGLPSKNAEQLLQCTNFDGTTFISDRAVADRLTWIRDQEVKSVSGYFRILPDAPFDLVIGKNTLFREKIFKKGSAPHKAGVLVTKKITKKEADENQSKAMKQKADSEALLKRQALAKTKAREMKQTGRSNDQGRSDGSTNSGP